MVTRAMPLGRALARITPIVETASTIARWLTAREIPATVDDRPGAPIDVGWLVAELQLTDAQGLFGFVRRLGLSDDQADDAVQEVLARLLYQLRAGASIGNPRSWAYRSIYRLAMDQHRLRRRFKALGIRLASASKAPPRDEFEDRVTVWAEVDRLPERQRNVIYLRYRSDLPFDEIGDVLGISSSAARSHSTQAMATLRARLGTGGEER